MYIPTYIYIVVTPVARIGRISIIMSSVWMRSIFLFTLTFDTVLGTGSDCGYFAYAHVASPLGSQFCTNEQYMDEPYANYSESFYFVCEYDEFTSNDIPYRYSFATANCTGNHTKDAAESYIDKHYDDVSTSYSCSDVQCDYVHYSLRQGPSSHCSDSSMRSVVNQLYTTYRPVDYCATYVDTNDTNLIPEFTYFAFACDPSALHASYYYESDCSGFPYTTVEHSDEYNCFTVHECSQSIFECGTTELNPQYHVGDLIRDVTDMIDDLCDTVGGEFLSILMPPLGYTCGSVTFLGAICNIFDIDSCTDRVQQDTIVASCWSSNTFSYGNISTVDGFKRYVGDNYGIDVTFESTSDVPGELYKQTEVYLDNCGRLDNYWIGGVYDSHDNGEQNDIVSDVVEYLVNQGIADAENVVGSVSSIDQQESNGVLFTDVVRSKRGLLLHYDEQDYLETYYGIYFCEFNVVGFAEDDSYDEAFIASYCINYCVQILCLLCVLFSYN
eukprot:250491_1